MSCEIKCNHNCFVGKIESHLATYPTEHFKAGEPGKALQLSQITVRSAQVEEQINKVLYSALIDMKYSSTYFSTEAFTVIDEKFNLWQLWYREITLFHKYLVGHNVKCSYYPEVLIRLAHKIEKTYTKRLSSFEVGKVFLKTHSHVFQEFCNNLSTLSITTPVEENIFEIGRLLLIGLETSIAEVLTIDSFLRNENTIFILPRVIRLRLNWVKLMWSQFKKPFKLKYFGFDPIVEEKILKQVEEAELNQYLIK